MPDIGLRILLISLNPHTQHYEVGKDYTHFTARESKPQRSKMLSSQSLQCHLKPINSQHLRLPSSRWVPGRVLTPSLC